ncbi:MAG TPA: Uma2 family endonuclease [Chloroflexi bacterium]|nr:Uma2 family endonuclease [Chloroflexota bacterium]
MRPAAPVESLSLNSGDRLSRTEFERRYHAHPEIKKAELIEGVVYVPSPIRYENHANPHFAIMGWLAVYSAATPGVKGGDNATLRLDFENEPQPDALLRLEPAVGGQSSVTEDDYLEGAPELIVEIAASSVSYDMHDKRRAYARNGVQEYLVIQMYEQKMAWFVLREGVYELLEPDEEGILRSDVFPGLRLNVNAFWAGDLAAMLATLQQGVDSSAHAAFVEQLKAKMT